MKRKIFILLTVSLLSCSLVGCGSATYVNIKTDEELNNVAVGKRTMVNIGNGLYYDSSTGIVYWWNGSLGFSNYSSTPSPYYAPNGLPYRYNSVTNTFEEIENMYGM